MKNIQTNGLIEKYLPADYVDSYSREIVCNQKITPEKFRYIYFDLKRFLECPTVTWIFMFQCGVVSIKMENRSLESLLL